MNELLDKISQYDILNNIVPGAIFIVFLNSTGIYHNNIDSLLAEIIVYYFIGAIISRVGSVAIEPLLILLGVVKYGNYSAYYNASRDDEHIKTLLASSNLYRSIISLSLFCIAAYSWEPISNFIDLSNNTWIVLACLAIMLLFIAAYRKQNNFVAKRIRLLAAPPSEKDKKAHGNTDI